MRVQGVISSALGEGVSQTDNQREVLGAENKIKEVLASGSAENSFSGSLNDELKQGLKRVFQKAQLAQVMPPSPMEGGNRRKKALASYQRFNKPQNLIGQKFNRSA